MKFFNHIKKGLTLAAALLAAAPVCSQDLLADIAPIDGKMQTIDSLELKRLVDVETLWDLENPAAELYVSAWTNKLVRMNDIMLPSEYKIDLRHFSMPCDSRKVTSQFGYRRRFRKQHYGTDIKVYVGDTIRAAFSGKVRISAYERRGYGRYILIRHPNGLETLYGHLSKQLVTEDQVVKAGEPIGLGGNTGRSYGSHLHFETRFLGRFINPEKLFNFEAQDILGDYYVYHASGSGRLLAEHEVVGGESDMSEQEAAALAKAEASERAQQKQAKSAAGTQSRVHCVKNGESLYIIAKKYGTTVENLCKLNNISKKATLRLGQIIKYS